MDLETAKREFGMRFYRWAIQDFRREVADGLPFIASIKGVATQRFLEIWPSLTEHERRSVEKAFLKWAHAEAVEITGEGHTIDEWKLFEAYRRRSLQECQLEKQIYRRRALGQGPVKTLNRRRFASSARRRLKAVFGDTHRRATYSTSW